MSTDLNKPFLLSLQNIPGTIRVEVTSPTDYFDVPVVSAQLHIESFTKEAGEDTLLLLQKIIGWVQGQHNRQLTETQAWDLAVSIRAAFELHKKKLGDTLISLTGITELIPTVSPPPS